jgi:molybdate transport system permease protein
MGIAVNDWFPLWLSLRVASTATVLATVFGVGLAYVLAKGRFRGRSVIEAIVTIPIVLPPTVLGYYLLSTFGTNTPVGRAWESLVGSPLVFTPAAAVIAATISALPFVVRSARAAIDGVDARYEDVLRVSGHPEWRIALLATLPLARRGVLAGVALGFARALGDFGVTVMIAGNIPGKTQTLSVAVYDAVQAGSTSEARTGSLVLAGIALTVLLVISSLSAVRTR